MPETRYRRSPKFQESRLAKDFQKIQRSSEAGVDSGVDKSETGSEVTGQETESIQTQEFELTQERVTTNPYTHSSITRDARSARLLD